MAVSEVVECCAARRGEVGVALGSLALSAGREAQQPWEMLVTDCGIWTVWIACHFAISWSSGLGRCASGSMPR